MATETGAVARNESLPRASCAAALTRGKLIHVRNPARAMLVGLTALALPGLMLAPLWRLGGLGAGEDDVLYYFPSRVLFHDSIRSGRVPWLNPLTGLTRAYVADPQSAFFYGPTWLFALLDPSAAYPALLWLHYSLALLGMYRLLRACELDWRAALFGAACFAFSGFMVAHRAHFTLHAAAAWAPVVLWRLARYARDGGAARLLAAVGAAAMQCFAGHVQIAALTAAGSLAWLLAAGGARREASLRWLLCWVYAGGLFAVQIMPTLSYMAECTRPQNPFFEFVDNSFSPLSLVNFVLPMFFGQRTPNFFDQPYWGPSHQVEQHAYVGVAPLALALLALRAGWRGDSARRGWVALLALGAVLALGKFSPVYPLLYFLPGASIFRVPARAMLLADIALIGLAATALHDLLAEPSPRRARLRLLAQDWTARWWLWILPVPVVLLGAAMIAPALPAGLRSELLYAIRPWSPAVYVPAAALLLGAAALHVAARRWQQPGFVWLLPVAAMLDLGVVAWSVDIPRGFAAQRELLDSPARQEWLSVIRDHQRRGLARADERVWVVTARESDAALPGEYIDPISKGAANTNILDGYMTLTDYGPLMPRGVRQRFGFEVWGEKKDPAELLGDTEWMRRYHVGWVLLTDSRLPAPADCEPLLVTRAGFRLFRYPHCGEPAHLEDATVSAVVIHETLSPTRMRTTCTVSEAVDAPLRLAAAYCALRGWRATVHGVPTPVTTSDGALLAVDLPTGDTAPMVYRVEWEYRPPGLAVGAGVSLVTLVLLALDALLSRPAARPALP